MALAAALEPTFRPAIRIAAASRSGRCQSPTAPRVLELGVRRLVMTAARAGLSGLLERDGLVVDIGLDRGLRAGGEGEGPWADADTDRRRRYVRRGESRHESALLWCGGAPNVLCIAHWNAPASRPGGACRVQVHS